MTAYTVSLTSYNPTGLSITPVKAFVHLAVKRGAESVCNIRWTDDGFEGFESLAATSLETEIHGFHSCLDFAIAIWTKLVAHFNEAEEMDYQEYHEMFEHDAVTVEL
jgi:hypothetical protein